MTELASPDAPAPPDGCERVVFAILWGIDRGMGWESELWAQIANNSLDIFGNQYTPGCIFGS